MDDGFFITLVVLFALGAIVVFVLKVVFVGFLIKKGIDAYQEHQEAFDRVMRQQQALLRNVPQRGGAISPQLVNQFQAQYWKAQNELRQLDDLRRQQSELRLSEMTGAAAEAGIFINPSSL